jgi:uncharacterized protein YgbK (DUF1537 family)
VGESIRADPHHGRTPALGILAEDLQSAVAVATRLRQRGLEPLVVRDPTDAATDADAIVVDLGLHHSEDDAEDRIREWSQRLRRLGCERIEAKLNAELRGLPDALVAGINEASEDGVLLVVPAYPTAGRVCVDGRLLAPMPAGGGLDVDVRESLRIPNAELVPLADVNQGATAVAARLSTQHSQGVQSFIFDGTVEAHLSTAAQVAGALRDRGLPVVTASTGGWLRFHPDLGRDGFVLVVAPASHEMDRAQLHRLGAAYGSRSLIINGADAAGWGASAIRDVIASHRVLVVHDTDGAERDRWAIAAHLAAIARRILDASTSSANRCLGIVTSGGLTTAALVEHLGGSSLRAGLELEPLCPAAHVTGGAYDGLRLLSKASGTGSEETLLRMTRQILGA